jgi:tetratricopeptide (TPR) repeat protein
VLERLAAREEERGDLGAAVEWARTLAGLEPLSEDAGRRLMRRLAAAGDQGAAIVAYERLRDRIASELAVGLSAATRELAAELRANGQRAAAAGAPGLPLPPLVAARQGAGFVGRVKELERLRRAWNAALGGGRAIAALAGHPGIGKTALGAEFALQLHADGAQVLFGRCYDDAVLPYQPFTEALEQLVAGLPPERLAGWATLGGGELTQMLPDLAVRAPDLPAPVAGDPRGARHRLFAAVAAVLEQAAAAAPVLLVVDDLHWADAPTLLMLGHLARVPRSSPLLILVTFRRAELSADRTLSDTIVDLDRDRLLQRITVPGLPGPEIAKLVTGATGRPPSAGVVRALRRHTDGNPFFVEQLLRHWSDTLPEGDERAVAAALRDRGLPAGVTDIVGRRLALLAPEAQRVLRLAAVLGREFDFGALAVLAELGKDELLAALAEPVRARVVAESAAVPGRFAFHHALVREVLYEGIAPTERTLLHRRAGAALEHLGVHDAPVPLAELVHHFALAPRSDAGRAAAYAEQAAERALASLAYEDAAVHFARALDLRPDAERAGRAELLMRLGEAQAWAGDLPAARSAFAAAAELARRLDEPPLLARAALGFAGRRIAQVSRREEPEIALLQEALARLGEADGALRARVLARLAHAHYTGDQHDEVDRLAAAALAAARASGDDTALIGALEADLFAHWVPGGAAERLRTAGELIVTAERARERDRVAEGLNWRLVAGLELGDLAIVDADIARYSELAEALRVPQLQNYAGVHRAMRALFDGRFADAEALASAAFTSVPGGTDDAAQLFGIQLFTLRDEQGRLAELEQPLAAYAANPDGGAPTWQLALAWARAELGQRDAALDTLRRLATDDFSVLPTDVTWPSSMSLAARLSAALGDAAAGATVHRLLAPFAGQHVVSAHAAYSGPVDHHLGLSALAAGRFDVAIGHFADALSAEEAIGCRPWGARTRAEWATALDRRGAAGDADAAATLADHALTTARELGMTRLAEQLDTARA